MFGFGQQKNPQAMQAPMGGLGGFMGDNSGMLMNAGLALLAHRQNSNQTPLTDVATAATLGSAMDTKRTEKTEERQTRNQTAEWLVNNGYAKDADEGLMLVQSGAVKDIFAEKFKPEKPATTDDITEYNFAKQQGYEGNFQTFMTDQRKAGATNVTVGQSEYGTIPQGYQIMRGEDGALSMQAIPGGPEDSSKQEAEQAGADEVSTRVVTSAAQRAREAASQRALGPYGQGVTQMAPWTDAAEVKRQVDVLKSQATVENLNAMRAQSPTGGALGNVTEKEGAMLAAKSGALDPSSPTFERDLADYELTLLQTVHGPEVGKAIFDSTRQQSGGDGWQEVEPGIRIRRK